MEQPDTQHPITYSQSKYHRRKRPVDVNRVADGLEQLAIRATQNDDEGGGDWSRILFLEIITSAVRRLNCLAKKQPDLWRDLSEGRVTWPVLASLHPFHVRGMKKGAVIRDFLEKTLHLGSYHAIPFDPYAKSKLSSPITRTAMQLISHVWTAWHMTYRVPGTAAHLLKQRDQYKATLTGWRRRAADLPPLSKANAPQWADVAIGCFLESYPHPEQTHLADEIGKHWKSWNKDPNKDPNEEPSHRETPGRIGNRIVERLHTTICKLLVDPPS